MLLMKSGVNMLRFLLLLLSFAVFQGYCSTCSANIENRFLILKFQNTNGATEKPWLLMFDNSPDLMAPPSVSLAVDTYQSRIAQLHWTTTDPGLAGIYVIQRNTVSTGWVTIASVPNSTLSYNDTISYPFCNPTNFSYRIQFNSASGVDDATSPIVNSSLPLSDLTNPENVSKLFVSLGPTILWEQNPTDSILKYEIQRYDPFTQSWPVVGSEPSSVNGFVDLSAPVPCGNTFKYIVRTFDKCNNNSAPDYENKYVQTMTLTVTQPVQCDKSMHLVWNSYKNMPGGLGGYKIFRNDGGVPVEINPVSATDTSYIDNFNFLDGKTYSYSVNANSIDNSFSSFSCEVFQPFVGVILPDTVYISQVSVENDSYISVGYYFTPLSSVVKLILERSDDNGSNFHAIDSILSPVPQQFHFNDTTANVHAQSYYYRLVAVDDCDNTTMSMNISQSIWLKCSTSQTQNGMDWNRYKEWLLGVEGYEIYRSLDQDPATVVRIGNVDQATITFPDLLTNYDQSKMACYWVEGKENPGNPYLQNAISKSNTCCVIKDAVLFLPNAFNPEGVNRLFRPVPSPLFVDAQSFTMTIFSRWGQQLFETSDMVNGWNGTINGQLAAAGQYTYLVTYKSLEGKDYTKRGTVMLVR
jgi:gliding motility-associated-like protein